MRERERVQEAVRESQEMIALRSKSRLRLDRSLELEPSTKLFKAFLKKPTDSSARSPSPATTRTFLILPPNVAISALTVFRLSDLSVSIKSDRRSDRSSQHSDAFIINSPSPENSLVSTLTSSVSQGRISSSGISEVCRFNSFTRWITLASNEALSV